KISPNEELADYLFSEETQEDPCQILNVLEWLQNGSYLGHWFSNPSSDDDYYNLKNLNKNFTNREIKELTEDYSAFEHQSWPLSIAATRIYAEMIRIDMNDDEDEYAAEIEKMEYAPLGLYKILKADKEHLTIKDFKKRQFAVRSNSFGQDIRGAMRKCAHVFCTLFSFRGEWYVNGLSTFIKMGEEQYDAHCERENENYSYYNEYQDQFDDLIERNGGRRLFFFKNMNEVCAWLRTEAGMENVPDDSLLSSSVIMPTMVFINPNGHLTLSNSAECVKSPDNPFYDKSAAENDGILLCLKPEICNPDLVLYLIEHNLVPDAMLNDIRGIDHGRVLMQENLDFLARCMRRDIKTDKVVRRRPETCMISDAGSTANGKKVNRETFVKMISQETEIWSKAKKEWRLVECDLATTVVLDVGNNKEFYIPTGKLYEAYRELDIEDIQVATVSQYVGSANGPAASALLYSSVGKGKHWNELKKNMDKLLKAIKRGYFN
ncbi:MAG: DUF3843 family protein, partial [Prevotella sp.]